jgi:hypothetical protein
MPETQAMAHHFLGDHVRQIAVDSTRGPGTEVVKTDPRPASAR